MDKCLLCQQAFISISFSASLRIISSLFLFWSLLGGGWSCSRLNLSFIQTEKNSEKINQQQKEQSRKKGLRSVGGVTFSVSLQLRPFPSCCGPHYESEAKCKSFSYESKFCLDNDKN